MQMKPVAVVPINPNKCSVLGCLLMNLEQLQYRNAIKLKPKLVAGPPHAQLLEAANLNKSCRYSDNMHAAVEVTAPPVAINLAVCMIDWYLQTCCCH